MTTVVAGGGRGRGGPAAGRASLSGRDRPLSERLSVAATSELEFT